MTYVIKNNGEKEEFDKGRIIQSCMRAGATVEQAEKIAKEVEDKIYEGITTKEIMKIVKGTIRKYNIKHVYIRYPLKDALFKLNPDNYEFEYYIANLFRYLGYEAIRSPQPKPQGFCVDHEIDVFLRKNNNVEFVEVKHKSKDEKYVHLDVVMYHYARLIDFKRGYETGRLNFTGKPVGAWVVTNTKFTYHAIKFASCYHMKLMGWNYPKEQGINNIIEKYKAYPLTLFGIKQYIRDLLFEKYGVIDAKGLYMMDRDVLRKYLKDNFNKVINKLETVMKNGGKDE